MTFLPLRVTCLANGKSLRFVDDHLQPEDRAGLAVPNLSLREAWPTSPSAGFFGFHGLPRPYTPGSHLVLRLSGNRFEDFSAEFPKAYDDEIQDGLEDLKRNNVTIAEDQDDQSYVLSIVFAYLYSGRPTEARKTLDQHWPADDRESIRQEIVSAYCGGLHKSLGLTLPAFCAAGDF